MPGTLVSRLKGDLMLAYLASYQNEELVRADPVTISDDYDGNPYGDGVPFAVGSNQVIVTQDDSLWDRCVVLEREPC